MKQRWILALWTTMVTFSIQSVILNTPVFSIAKESSPSITLQDSANNTATQYTLSFAAKVNNNIPAGTYTHSNVLMVVANDIIYNINYDNNSESAVTNMPTPTPQIANTTSGTPAADSYATLSSTEPTLEGKRFGGWCDVATTVDASASAGILYAMLKKKKENEEDN